MWNGLPEDLRSTIFFKEFPVQSGGNFVSANVIIQVMGSFKTYFSRTSVFPLFFFFSSFYFLSFRVIIYFLQFFLLLGDISFYS